MGCKAVETTTNVNNTSGPGTANEHTVQGQFKKLCKGDDSLEDEEHCGQPSEVNSDPLRATIEADPLTITWEVAEELNIDLSMVVRHLKQIGRVKKFDKWLPHELTEKKNRWSVAFSYSMQQQWNISWSNCDVWWKVDFIQQPVITSSVVGPRRSSKALPKTKLAPKKGMVTVCWSAAHMIHYSLLNPSEPLHLRSMFSKLMRCTKNCNACSQYWATERAQFFSMTMLDHTSQNQRFKSFTNWATKFCLICSIHLTSCQLTTTSSSILTTFCKENVSTTSGRQKILSKSLLNPEAQIFMLQE